MNDNFEKIYKFILSIEGTYSNNPYDRGGETWAGLTKNFLISHSLRVPPDWETIYSGYRIVYEYLKDPDKKTFLLDELPYSLSLVIFDLLFHHGFTLGTKILQVALCVD
ncbi:MAG: glycosyl hydrolase 108 family protein, partial [candidate division WOR-3 bacterium]